MGAKPAQIGQRLAKHDAVVNRQKIAAIRHDLNNGRITYNEAKAQAEPIIASINDNADRLAKKYGRRRSHVNFAGLMR